MEILGVKFAPLHVPIEERLQTLAAAIWLCTVLFGYIWGPIITIYLLFYTETVRYFALLYFLWMYYDWDTCNRGGRSELWTRLIKKNVFWRYFCNYFPLKLVKTVDLNPNKSYLFVCVPHGIFSIGVTGSFGTDAVECKKLFPGLEMRIVTLEQNFKVPLFRDYIYFLGFCASSARSIEYLLSTPPKSPYTGKATLLIVGGIAELMESIPDTYRICIKKRKGFVKIALKHGTPLVPVVSFGETNLFNQIYCPEGSIFRRIQNYIRSLIGVPPFFLSGRGFFQYSFGLIPKRLPVTVVVGSPLELPKIPDPTSEDIDKYHDKFVKHLVEFFQAQKHNYINNAENVTLDLNV